MFQLNLKIALRTLWKSKGYTLLNIFGLSIGLAGFIMILMYANYERSYDSWNPEADNIYRISIRWGVDQDEFSSSQAELAPALKESLPEIEDYGRTYSPDARQRLVSFEKNEMFVNNVLGVDSNWFNLFPYKFIYGDAKKAILTGDQIVLSSKISEKLFGNINPVGKILKIDNSKNYTVSGVYQEPNTPETMESEGFIKSSSTGDGWNNANFNTYLKLRKGTDRVLFAEKLNKAFQNLPALKGSEWLSVVKLYVTPVKDIYLHSTTSQDQVKKGNPAIIGMLVLFSGLLLVISCINFTNMSIAQSVKRAKETGVRKVLGAGRGNLITYFLTETTIQCIAALLFSFAIAEVFMPVLNNLMEMKLSLFSYERPGQLALQIGGVMLVVIILSGGYASFFLSNYDPVKVLKGNFSRSGGSVWLRKSLIAIQFIVATVFMVSLMIIKQQVNHIKNQDAGFNKDHVLVFKIRNHENRNNFKQIKQRLLNIDGVNAVSRVNYYPGVKDMQVIGRQYKGETVQNLSMVTVDYDYFKVMGMSAVEGRVFSDKFATDSAAIVVNETALKKYKLKDVLGQTWINNATLVGVVKDHIQKGMENGSDPTAYMIEGRETNAANNVIMKISGVNSQQTIEKVKELWQSVEPFPFQYEWLDQSFAKVYVQYVRLDKLFNIFTYVTLAIAVLGLFALASFTVQERTKEIGVRKVLGAETKDILQMVNKSFLILVIVANLIALPVAYILSSSWLSGFAYRTSITICPFLLATTISIIITIITVSLQAYKTANAKPIDALKYE